MLELSEHPCSCAAVQRINTASAAASLWRALASGRGEARKRNLKGGSPGRYGENKRGEGAEAKNLPHASAGYSAHVFVRVVVAVRELIPRARSG